VFAEAVSAGGFETGKCLSFVCCVFACCVFACCVFVYVFVCDDVSMRCVIIHIHMYIPITPSAS